ncbi:uncharacterized protein ColSpa_06697 [Colletotrichum spaethianum]|uniref:Clr5 domain-containing protein n=1 Tax=Colletotrichum spaethianum TaxID=700344 RepID=A0AA37LDW5_9PEZI|nr:uncharacterized protein ColSpa_06697 [Colletotrichum spaethianum]GKT46516.1 hypothetical protein ColSpa_06697 [Colletotrichum spaethianum]
MTKAWREKQADITRLYIHENKTLNEVKAIMEEQHDFKASTRSYRQQFDKWGLAKYNCKKRTARRRSQDDSGHQHHHQSAGQYYPDMGANGGGGGGGASDFAAADPDAYDQSMSPQSCGSSLSSESAVEGGVVEDMMEGSYPHQQPQSPYQYQQQQQRPQVYSAAPLMPARRESVPYYGGVECVVRQSRPQ